MDLEPSTSVDIPTAPTVDELREEIDNLDKLILDLVQRRTEVARQITRSRMAQGGTRIENAREMQIIERYSSLGSDGQLVAGVLLRLSRGRMDHRNQPE